MLDGIKVGIVISGDPERQSLAEALYKNYSDYEFVDEVALYYRKNPAFAFNKGAAELSSPIYIGVAGDVYVGEKELERFARLPHPIVFAWNPLTPRKKEGKLRYPEFWSERHESFISGLFRINRQLLVDYNMPTEPSYSEDILWDKLVRPLGLNPVAVQVPCSHIDYHNRFIPRFRVLLWAVLSYDRFGATRPAGAFVAMMKTLGWELQEIYVAISGRAEAVERRYDRVLDKWSGDAAD